MIWDGGMTLLDYLRIACAVPAVRVGDVRRNTADIIAMMDRAEAAGADVLVLPEMALTGYTCQDLFFQEELLTAAEAG